jgi:hypothetical protein
MLINRSFNLLKQKLGLVQLTQKHQVPQQEQLELV